MIEFFRFAAKALAATAITVVAVIGGLLFFTFATPSETVEIPLSDLGMTARVEVRSDFNSHVYWLRATTPYGSIERRLWEHWGPATRINFYQTPDDWLVMLGGGGSAEMIHLKRANEVQGPSRRAKIKYQAQSRCD